MRLIKNLSRLLLFSSTIGLLISCNWLLGDEGELFATCYLQVPDIAKNKSVTFRAYNADDKILTDSIINTESYILDDNEYNYFISKYPNSDIRATVDNDIAKIEFRDSVEERDRHGHDYRLILVIIDESDIETTYQQTVTLYDHNSEDINTNLKNSNSTSLKCFITYYIYRTM